MPAHLEKIYADDRVSKGGVVLPGETGVVGKRLPDGSTNILLLHCDRADKYTDIFFVEKYRHREPAELAAQCLLESRVSIGNLKDGESQEIALGEFEMEASFLPARLIVEHTTRLSPN